MFSRMLQELRSRTGLSTQRLAELAGTSQPTISTYEAGKKIPRFDTAERILEQFGVTIAPVRVNSQPVLLDRNIVASLTNDVQSMESRITEVRIEMATLVESDLATENIELSWGTILTRTQGITVNASDPLDAHRLDEITNSIQGIIDIVESGKPLPQLNTIAKGALIAAHEHLPAVTKELDFMVRATSAGANPVNVRHLSNAHLIAQGHPWLHVPYRSRVEHRKAIVACLRSGSGDRFLRTLEPLAQKELAW